MADPNTAPDLDPFAQLDSSAPLAASQSLAPAKPKPADPFAELDSSAPFSPPSPETSATGAFTRSAARGVLPALGSLPAMVAGADLGAAAGTPLAPFTGGLSIPALTIAGGLGGAFGGATLVGKLQDYALKALPDSWQDKLGMSDRQQQLDEKEHSAASFLGGIAPYALTMKPGISLAKAKLPENATALQRIMANPATKVLFGGAAMGGIQLAQEKVSDQGEGINWNRVAIATGFGMVFNRPTRFGERITGPATELTQQIPWVARQQSRRAVQGQAAAPTLNQAADAKVMGPGVTEPVFQGAHAQDPAAEMTAQQAVRDEQAVLGTEPAPSADLHAKARAAHPELFDQYDALVASRDTFRQWLNETADTESAAVATLHLHDLQGRIDAMAPEIQAAYRRAEEATGTPPGERPGAPERFPTFAAMLAAHGAERPPALPTVAETPAAARAHLPSAEVGVGASEGAPGPQPVPPRSIAEQRDFIAQDVSRQMLAAGKSQAEATEGGKLWAHFFETAAKSFKGALGSPEELYRREGAEIRGRKAPPAAPAAAAEPAPPLAPADQAKAQNLDVTKDVVSGANSSKDPNGPVVIDRRIPQLSPILKDNQGNPVNLWNLLQIHERVERDQMAAGKTYEEAHPIATAAEREAARRWGIDFDAYTKEIDGYLSHIEHEKVENPPADTHIDPQEAIGHHRSENKPAEPEPETIHVTARKPGGPAARDERTFSLLEFLASRGGIRSDDGNVADVRSSIGQNKFIPGFGQLIRNPAQLSTAARRSGRGAPMSLDAAREAAVHAGYLEDKGEQTGGLATSSTRDLLEAIDAEARGEKQYRIGYIPENRPQEPAALNREGKKFIKTLRSEIEKHGGELTIPEEARALELWEREGLEDHGEIIERLALENDDRAIDGQHTNGQEPAGIPGWDDDAGRAPGEGQVLPAVSEPGGAAISGTARAGGEGEREWAEFFQRRGQPRDLIAEREAEGQQQIPGADRISQAELVQRRANAPLKPAVPQKPADEGLFGDEGKQKELFQAPIYYSAVARAVEDARQEKASPEQWLATIRNTQGVKQEEMDWLGLPDWLKEQKGPVTKQQIADYVRANQIEVKEVAKGGEPVKAAKARQAAILQRLDAIQSEFDARYNQNFGEGRSIHGDPAEFAIRSRLAEEEAALKTEYNSIDRTGEPKFGSYALPGGENYRELLLTLPSNKPEIPAPEPITELPPGYLVIHYGGNPPEREWAVIPPGQQHARPIHGTEAASEADAARKAVEQINLNNRYRHDEELRKAEQGFKSSHWDEPNVLAHIRFDDRTIEGKKTLHVAEIQSDWHQKGRREGYRTAELEAAQRQISELAAERHKVFDGVAPGDANYPDALKQYEELTAKIVELNRQFPHSSGLPKVPDAPFKTTWPELALKRIIRYAAENGYDRLSWDTGETNAERYDLSKQIKKVTWISKAGEPFGTIRAWTHDGVAAIDRQAKPEELPDIIGKEAADKLINSEPTHQTGVGRDSRSLEGLDLKVGGEGMKGFYDKILPAAASKLTKKYGAKIGEGAIGTGKKAADAEMPEEARAAMRSLGNLGFDRPGEAWAALRDDLRQGYDIRKVWDLEQEQDKEAVKAIEDYLHGSMEQKPVHTLDITPQLREAAVAQGFPLFQSQLGKITFREGMKPIMELAQSSDPSTFIHESGHLFLELMTKWAEHPQAPDALKADLKTTLDWLGVESPDAIKTRHHEKFARGFEQYLREGVAPSPELASVFSQFREWLLKIYQTIRGLGTEITPEIRGVFDRLLASEPQRTVIAPERAKSPTFGDVWENDAAHTEPHEAEPAGDRILKETEQYASNIPGSVIDEHATSQAKRAAEEAAKGASTTNEPGGQAGAGAVAEGQVQPDRGGPEHEPVGGAGGAPAGEGLHGGGNAVPEGVAKPTGGERPGEPSHADANLGDKPLAPRPKPHLGAPESPFLDKAGNIRIENLTTREDVAQAIRDAAKENQDFIGDRRGVVTDGQVMDLAEDIGMAGAEKMLRERITGQAFNAEQIMAARKLLVDSAMQVSAAMKKAATGTDEDVMAYAQAKDRHQMIQGQIAGITAEAGRALRAFRNITGMSAEAQAVDQILRDATGKTLFQLRREAKLGATLTSPQQVSKFMADAQKPTFGRMILEYWINGLISGPATHATYAIGNTILAAEKAGPETAAAAAIGAVRRAMGRGGETVRLGEVAAQFKAGVRATVPATKAFLDALRTGTTVALPGEQGAAQNVLAFPGAGLAQPALYDEAAKFSDVMASAFGIVRGIRDGMIAGAELARAAGVEPPLVGLRHSALGSIPDIEIAGYNVLPISGTILRLPSRGVGAIHSFFRGINYSMEKAANAYRTAANEGLTGTAFDARVADIHQKPSQALMERIAGTSSELTLMGQGGEFTRALSRLTNAPIFGLPLLKFIDPFVHISSNVIQKAIIERTPVGILSPELRADLMGRNGNIAQDTAMARMLVGTAYAVGLGALAAEGYVSGSGPSDPRQAATWRLAGNQAHSVRVGDIWYDVHRLGPLGMLLGISADLYDVSHAAAQGDMILAASHLQHAITQNVLDESFMRGPSDLIRAVEDPGRYGEAYVRNFLSSFVPYSVGLAQIARASDPYSRQARSVMDEIKQKIPGLSESLLPRRDIWGNEVPNKDALISAGVTAIYEQRVSRDPVNLALLDLGIYPAQLQRKVRNVDLTDQQYDGFQRIAGRMTKMRLDAIVNAPDYRTWPNHVRHDVIAEVIAQSREAARGMLMMKYPEIPREAAQMKLDKVRGVK